MSIRSGLAERLFIDMIERAPTLSVPREYQSVEGIVKSVNEFVELLVTANKEYNSVFQIPETKQIIFAEEMPGELVIKLNNNATSTDFTESTLPDLKIVTYLASEKPAVISARRIDEDGIRNIKWKFGGHFTDPEYTGYSIIRYSKEIEATITFKVWGKYFQDIRERASLLKDVIDKNTWYFKHKGLRDIVWLGSEEEELWDNKNLAKCKTEKYLVRFSEIKEIREKNLEQIVAKFGLAD